MKKEKIKYILKIFKNYLELVAVIYLVYTLINGIIGYDLKFGYSKNGNMIIMYDVSTFYTNSLLHHIQYWSHVSNTNIFLDLKDRYGWVLTLEIIFIIIVPALIIIGLELKKHNSKVKEILNNKRLKSTEKKKIKLEKQLKHLKDKEL